MYDDIETIDNEFVPIKILYLDNGREEYFIGVMPKKYLDKVDEKHQTVYAYKFEDLNTDDIVSFSILN